MDVGPFGPLAFLLLFMQLFFIVLASSSVMAV
jgi:hypothetical protein